MCSWTGSDAYALCVTLDKSLTKKVLAGYGIPSPRGRLITREGLKVLEVSASEASYFKNDKAIQIIEPKVVFYEGGERVGEVSSAVCVEPVTLADCQELVRMTSCWVARVIAT